MFGGWCFCRRCVSAGVYRRTSRAATKLCSLVNFSLSPMIKKGYIPSVRCRISPGSRAHADVQDKQRPGEGYVPRLTDAPKHFSEPLAVNFDMNFELEFEVSQSHLSQRQYNHPSCLQSQRRLLLLLPQLRPHLRMWS